MTKSKTRYTPHGDRHGNRNNHARAQGPKCVEPTGASRLALIRRERWYQGWVHDGGHRHRLSWGGSRSLEGGERAARRRETRELSRALGTMLDASNHLGNLYYILYICRVPTDAAKCQHFFPVDRRREREKKGKVASGMITQRGRNSLSR